MLERVFGLWVQRLLIDEFPRKQTLKEDRELQAGQLDDGLEQGLAELLADDGGRLQQALLGLREPVDPRGEQSLDAVRDAKLLHRLCQTVCSSCPDEGPRVDERLDDLFDEERVPLGSLLDQVRQLADAGVRSQQLRQ